MSGALSGVGFADLGQLTAGLTRTRQNFDRLTEQASSGLISNTYAGLGGTAPASLTLGPQVADLQTAQNNIAVASGPAQVTQTAMTQIQSIAANLLAEMPTLNGVSPAGIDSVAASARSDLATVADLLDSQYDGVYVFAGQDTANPPVPDPDQITTSGFYTQINAAVSTLSTNGAAATVATVATTLTIASSTTVGNSPFSATYLAQSATGLTPPSVATGDGQSQSLGLLASANIGPVSTGTSTTGSYMLDLMRALATVGSLSSTQASDPNFAGVVADTQTSMTGAISSMSTDVGILGEQQSSLTTLSTTLSDTQTVLTGQLSSAQDVDMATTLSNLSLMQTQLQESYQLIAAVSGLSLAKFLPAA
jgi:flagellar hook-associated protein 3 FlgL